MNFLQRVVVILSLIKIVQLSSINILDSNFIQTGNFTLSQGVTSISIQFAQAFNSTPNIITSLTYLDTLNNQLEIDFQIYITNINSTGFLATIDISSFSYIFQVNYTYIATTASNIYSFYTSNQTIFLDNIQDQNYNIYSTKIPYSKKNLLSNPKMNVLVVGFMTGFYQDYFSNILSVSFQITQPSNDANNFLVTIKEDLQAQWQLNEIRYNYFEFYYQENNSIMMKIYQDQTYEFISSTSNCLYNNLIQSSYTNNLSSTCKKGLCCDDLNLKYTRLQTTPSPINTMKSNKQNIQIGFSKIYSDLNVQNGRLIISDFYFIFQNNSNGMYITYKTWQGSKILGVTSTFIEYYSLSCPTGYFYSFSVKDCVITCESQTYPEQNLSNSSLLPSCNPCSSSCLQCSGPLPTNCKSCPSSLPVLIVQNNQCQSQQPSTGYVCQQSTDTSLPYQQNCYSCDPTCLTCSGSLPTNCLSCNKSFPYFVISTNQCLSAPKSNFQCQQSQVAPTYQFNCQDCSPNCLTCFGPLSTNCQSCPLNLPFFNTQTNECLQQAPAAGYYCQNSSGSSPIYQKNCYPCYSSCLQCSGPLSTNCLSCTTSFPFYDLSSNSCLASAPSQGYFCQQNQNTSLTYQQNCQLCDPTCLTCTGSLPTNCINCTSSFPYFNLQTNSCLSKVPGSNFYCIQNSINPTYQFNCNTCNVSCLSCTGPQANNCLSCPPTLPIFNTITNQCLAQAPSSGYYCQNSSDISLSYQQNCSPCDPSCLQCSGPLSTNCLSCNTNLPFYNLKNNTCLAQAPNQGYFCQQSSKQNLSYQQDCSPCDSTCLTCSGSLSTNCISCTSSYPYFNIQANSCNSKVPSANFYCKQNLTNPTYQFNCNICNVSCLTCQGPQSNNCLTCPSSLPYFNTQTNGCLAQAPSQGYYCQSGTSISPSYQQNCFSCDSTCLQCSGPLSTNCLSCTTSFPFYNLSSKSCLVQAPNQGYFCLQNPDINFSYQKNCLPCDSTCLTCSGSLQNNCLSCSTQFPYFNTQTNQCLSNTPGINYYCQNNINNPIYQLNCYSCSANCLTCNGSQPNNCLTCPSSLPYYNTSTSECLLQIPSSAYFCQNGSSSQPSYQQNCYPCDISCQFCKGSLATDCTACSQSYPYYNTLSNICMSQKPSPGFICQQSQSSNPPYQQNCYSCNDPNCLVCIDVSPNSCIQCQANTYLYNKSCSLTKPSPAYCDSQNNCLACTIQFCLSCDQGPETCSLCPPSFYIDQNSYQCKCPYASYLDVNNDNYQCLSCPSNCAICLNSTTCQQCASNSLPDPLNPGNCILNCQQGQFYNRQSQSCQQCAPTCLTCFGSKNNCLSCKSGAQTVFNSANNNYECICIDQKDTLNNLTGICQKCPDPLCQQCDPNNRSLCLQCITQASFSQTDQKCECSQSTYYISSTNSCISCPQANCLDCLPDGSQCVKCKSGFYYDSNFQTCSFCKQGKFTDNQNKCSLNCIDQCEQCSDSSSCSQYYSNATFVGSQCYFTCSKCTGSDSNQCLECSSSTRILDQQTNSCVCQPSFTETNKEDCQFNPSSNILFKIASIMTNIQYFIYLPTLFVNHHPFSDYFLMNSQLIGNHFYSKQQNQAGIFTCHNAKFNYFNLLDSQILVFSQEIPLTKNSSNVSNTIVFFGYAFLSYAFIAIGFVYFKIVDSKCINMRNPQRSLVLKYFLNWNLFIKVNRISSNMILMYSINNLELFKQLNFYSICATIYGMLYLVFLLLEVYVVKIVPNNQQFKFLTHNLNHNSQASLMFWIVAEFKKIAFCSCFLLSETLAAFHCLIIIEYAFRMYLKLNQKQLQKSLIRKQNNSFFQTNNCFIYEQKIKEEGISIDQIQSILNVRTFSIQLSKRKTIQRTQPSFS
ncbi:hypothetical protein ABPG74_004093 [Tetrahymena malaccensis]